MADRWQESNVPRGAAYDRRFEELAAAGGDVHGEAALVDSYAPASVLDAGCGTGRVAIELSRRGHRVVGVDVDPGMLEVARAKAPDLTWVEGDLADPGLDFGRPFDVVVMAGNVLIFVPPGTEAQVLANAPRWLAPGAASWPATPCGPAGSAPSSTTPWPPRCGLELEDRWSTWDRRPFAPGDCYAVSVHRKTADPGRAAASPRGVHATEHQLCRLWCTEPAAQGPSSLGLRAMGTEELDPIDHHIIELLSQNARRTMADIGEQVSLSASAVTRRIERLERAGVIAGYTVVVDHRKAGRPIQAFTEVRFAGTADLQEIKETAMQLSEVQAVFTTAGDPDALVWLQVPDVERLGQVIEQLRRRGRVTGTKTLIVLDTWSRHRAIEANGLPVRT